MHHLAEILKRRLPLMLIYLANLFLSFHYFTTAYVNSSFLGVHVSANTVNALYMLASVLNIAIFLYVSTFLRAFGNYRLTLIFALLDLLSVFGLAYATELQFILPLFVLHQALVPMILFNLDVFLEHQTKDEGVTGETRGIFLTITNLALVLSPLFLAWLNVGDHDFSKAYLLSGLFLMPLILIVGISMRGFKDETYRHFNLDYEFVTFLKNKNLGAVFAVNFLLQLFYVFMVIYMPIYLTVIVGFSWQDFSLMLSIALLPFLLFELPAGELADHKFGEKEMMGAGFVIMAVSLAILSYLHAPSFAVFATALFMTRLGAALVEVTSESYFFKQTKEGDADLLGIFRITRPVSYLVGPILGGVVLTMTNYQNMFLALSVVMLFGLFFVYRITDTR